MAVCLLVWAVFSGIHAMGFFYINLWCIKESPLDVKDLIALRFEL